MKPDRILVTGGAGFIGSTTVDALLAKGKQVVVLDNLYSGKLTNLDLSNPLVELIEGDILEYPLVRELVAGVHGVLHLAAIPSVPLSIDDPMYTTQVNAQGFLHVLQAIKESGEPKRLVYASSAAVYGDEQSLPCRDTANLKQPQLSPYALQKRQCEQWAELYSNLHGIPSLGLRYFNVYGLRQDPSSPYSGVISKFLTAYLEKNPLKVYGDGEQTRDFIHVNDVARANCLALDSEYSGVVNIATGHAQSLLYLIDCLRKAGGEKAITEFVDKQAGDILHSYADTSLAKQELDFTHKISLQEGIKELLEEWRVWDENNPKSKET